MHTWTWHQPTAAVLGALFVLAGSGPADATIAFHGPSRYFPVASPTSVAIADLDRDGHADLVVTNGGWYPASSVSIMRGSGDGTFETQQRIPMGTVPEAVVVEDFDGDGLLDVAVSHHGVNPLLAGNVSILRGNGDGTFRAATDYAAGNSVRSLRAAELDGNGALDLVTEGVVLLGRGDGTFAPAAAYGGVLDSYVAVGDVNRDGHPDLVTSYWFAEYEEGDASSGACMIRLGNADGTFQTGLRFGRGTWCHDLEVADLDRDGLPDLVVANYGGERGESSGVMFHRGRGDGTFDVARLIPTALNPMSVAVADLNADGWLDLITANNGNDPDFDEHSLTILLANGDGTFERQPELHTGEAPIFVAVGRLDADETQDLVAADVNQSALSVFIGNGDGTFGNPDLGVARGPLGLVAADLDRDGRADLAMTMGGPYSGPSGSVILGRGDGKFRDPLDLPPSTGRGFLGVAKLDGDLAPDLVLITAMGVSAMLANGDGTFRTSFEASLLSSQVPGIPAIADFDRDGRMDLAVPHNYESDVISILLGRGDGSFGPSVREPTARYPCSAVAGDLNEDGIQDLVVGLDGYSVSVLLGHGDGTFAPHVAYGPGNHSAAPVGLADLDEDGRLDVVNGNLVWIGNGDGTLRAGTRFDTWHSAYSVVLEDLDDDHHVDLALLYGGETRTVSLYPGRGDGTFGTRVDYGTGASPRSMTAGDFDGDGRIDLAVANYGSASISLLLNRSPAPAPVHVRFELRPAVLNPRSQARWITGILEMTEPHSVRDIDVGSLRLNGVVPVDPAAPRTIGDQDRDGAEELVVRFDYAAVLRTLSTGERVPVLLTGEVKGESLAGADTVRVLGRGVRTRVFDEAVLAVRSLSAQPVQAGRLRLAVTLADELPARLELVDIAGRVVHRSEVGALGPGSHEVEIRDAGRLAAGIYFVRLLQGSQEAVARAVVLR